MADEQVKRGRRKVLGAAVGLGGGLVGLSARVALGSARPAVAPRRIGVRRFEGKVVIVTGATPGIGRGGEQETAAAGGPGTYVRTDGLVEEEVQAFVEQVGKAYGRPNVAVNEARLNPDKPP